MQYENARIMLKVISEIGKSVFFNQAKIHLLVLFSILSQQLNHQIFELLHSNIIQTKCIILTYRRMVCNGHPSLHELKFSIILCVDARVPHLPAPTIVLPFIPNPWSFFSITSALMKLVMKTIYCLVFNNKCLYSIM